MRNPTPCLSLRGGDKGCGHCLKFPFFCICIVVFVHLKERSGKGAIRYGAICFSLKGGTDVPQNRALPRVIHADRQERGLCREQHLLPVNHTYDNSPAPKAATEAHVASDGRDHPSQRPFVFRFVFRNPHRLQRTQFPEIRLPKDKTISAQKKTPSRTCRLIIGS